MRIKLGIYRTVYKWRQKKIIRPDRNAADRIRITGFVHEQAAGELPITD